MSNPREKRMVGEARRTEMGDKKTSTIPGNGESTKCLSRLLNLPTSKGSALLPDIISPLKFLCG